MKTIFARIVQNKNNNSNAMILHFFGEKKESLYWSDLYTTNRSGGHGMNPYSFLALHNFKCVNDKFFQKKYLLPKVKKK